ncbi:MAG: hypothetical protein RI897_4113 [Verrucomicrobiota bacterium]
MEGAGGPEEVGPDFGFDEDDRFGLDRSEGFFDPREEIERVVDFGDGVGELFLELGHAGGGGGGDHEAAVREGGLELLDEADDEVGFADTDCVEPDGWVLLELLLEFFGEAAEALGETGFPLAAADESYQQPGEHGCEDDEEREIVGGLDEEGPHGVVGARGGLFGWVSVEGDREDIGFAFAFVCDRAGHFTDQRDTPAAGGAVGEVLVGGGVGAGGGVEGVAVVGELERERFRGG